MTNEEKARSEHTEDMLARAAKVRESINDALRELAELTADLRRALDTEDQ